MRPDDARARGSGKTAIVLIAHGSTEAAANQSVAALARSISERAGSPCYPAFLDVTRPALAEAVAEAVGGGAKRVIIIPYFLMLGVHVREDLPRLAREQQQRFPEVEIRLGQALEGHPELARIVLDRVRDAMKG